VIPGVSSVNGVTASVELPLTKRGINDSFWVVTATNMHGQISKDMILAAQSSATVVILMGIRKLLEIVELFQETGKGSMPAMIIQNGTLPNEKIVKGTINDISIKAMAAQIGSPGIIIVGEVVALKLDTLLSTHPQIDKSTA
jgi:uroporphyrin-III C-methyltransferase